jgi:hypothetical protein
MESILTTIKKMLGIEESFTNFDDELIVYINGVFTTLSQLGIGAPNYIITGKANTWTEFVKDAKNLEAVKTYIYLKTRLVFDPPASSTVITAIEKQISEIEWRLWQNAEDPKVNAEIAKMAELTAETNDES